MEQGGLKQMTVEKLTWNFNKDMIVWFEYYKIQICRFFQHAFLKTFLAFHINFCAQTPCIFPKEKTWSPDHLYDLMQDEQGSSMPFVLKSNQMVPDKFIYSQLIYEYLD